MPSFANVWLGFAPTAVLPSPKFQLKVNVSVVPGSVAVAPYWPGDPSTRFEGPVIVAMVGATFVTVMMAESWPVPPSSSVTVRVAV